MEKEAVQKKIRLCNEANVLLKVCRLRDKQRTMAMKKQYSAAWKLQELLNEIEQRKAHIIYTYVAKQFKGNNFFA